MSGWKMSDEQADWIRPWATDQYWCRNRDECDGTCESSHLLIGDVVEMLVNQALAEQRDAIAREIHAAKPKHFTRDYTPVDQAYDSAAAIARDPSA